MGSIDVQTVDEVGALQRRCVEARLRKARSGRGRQQRALRPGLLLHRGVRVAVPTVLDVHTLKPFDSAAVAEHARGRHAVVVVEEHNVEGGLGTMVADALAARGVGVPIYKHGLYDEFGIVGPPTHLYRYYSLDADGIVTVIRRVLERVDTGRAYADAGSPVRRRSDRDRVLEELGPQS